MPPRGSSSPPRGPRHTLLGLARLPSGRIRRQRRRISAVRSHRAASPATAPWADFPWCRRRATPQARNHHPSTPRPATTTPLSPRPATTTPLSPRPATTSPGVRPAPGPAPGSALPRTRSPPTAARQPLRGQPKSLLPVPLRAGAPRYRPGGRPSLSRGECTCSRTRPTGQLDGRRRRRRHGSSTSGSNSNSLPQKATPPN